MPLLISLFRRAITSRGVPAGANIAIHAAASKPGTPDSATVGMSGAPVLRLMRDTASARSLPLRTCGSAPTVVSNISDTWPAIRSVSAGGPPR